MKRLSVFSLLLGFLTFILSASTAYAVDVCPAGQFDPLCKLGATDSSNLIGNVFNILLVAAVFLSIGFLILGGIKWITSGGDKARLDAARGTITGAVIGLVITFSTFFILSLVNYFFGIDGGQRGTLFVLPQLNNTLPNYPVNGPAGGGDDGGGAPPDNTKGDGKGNF